MNHCDPNHNHDIFSSDSSIKWDFSTKTRFGLSELHGVQGGIDHPYVCLFVLIFVWASLALQYFSADYVCLLGEKDYIQTCGFRGEMFEIFQLNSAAFTHLNRPTHLGFWTSNYEQHPSRLFTPMNYPI